MIVIQGAGINGLTLAGLLERRGLNYLVVEQSPQLRPVGAGLVLQRNALDVLATLTQGDFAALSTPIEQMVIGSIEEPVLQAIELDHATRARGVHRGDLQAFLLQQIDQQRLQLGSSVEAWKVCGDGLDVRLTSGEQLRAQILVGADGISSEIRTALTGSPHVRDSGQWCARTVIRGQPTGADAREIHAGRHRLGAIPLADGCTYVFWVCSRHADGSFSSEEIEEHVAAMGELGSTLSVLFTPAQQWLQHPLTDIPVYWGKERVVLVGDAAHALTPNLGQGAALGIEDAYVLAGLLDSVSVDTSLLLQQFRKQRHKRVRNIRSISYLMGKIAHLEGPVLRNMRNRLLKAAPPMRSRVELNRWLDQFAVEPLPEARS